MNDFFKNIALQATKEELIFLAVAAAGIVILFKTLK